MKPLHDFVGKTFGRLTVISRELSQNTHISNANSYWRCLCSCGKETIVLDCRLIIGKTKSCGCLRKHGKPYKNLIGQVFNRLTVISLADKPITVKSTKNSCYYYNCRCICGKEVIINGAKLRSGYTRSCGCLLGDITRLLPQNQPKYSAEEVAARTVWGTRYKEMSFEDYYRLAKLNCFYCGAKPSMKKKGVQKNNDTSFVFNTLDRIDRTKGHTSDNVVPACMICNCGKFTRLFDEFLNHINDLVTHFPRPITPSEYRASLSHIILLENTHYALLTSIRSIYNTSYNDGDLDMKRFYQLSMGDCYYCGAKPSNKCRATGSKSAIANGTFIYNGLDRLDSSLPHNYDNCVPCCKYCNFAKRDITLHEFDDWIERLAKHSRSPYMPGMFL